MIGLGLLVCAALLSYCMALQLINRRNLPRKFGEFITVSPDKIGWMHSLAHLLTHSRTHAPAIRFTSSHALTYAVSLPPGNNNIKHVLHLPCLFTDASICLEDDHFTQLLVEKGYSVHIMNIKVSQLLCNQVPTRHLRHYCLL